MSNHKSTHHLFLPTHHMLLGAVLLCAAHMPLLGGCAEEVTPQKDAQINHDSVVHPRGDSARPDSNSRQLDQGTAHDRSAQIDSSLHDAHPVFPEAQIFSDGPMPDFGLCAPVMPQNPKSAWALRAPAAGFGGIETVNHGGHTDVFLKSPNNLTRVGVRLNWGGTVVFFGLSNDPSSNVIDDNDTGRELQIALYDQARRMQGCAYNASCPAGACPTDMEYLGWNPVQGGDECGNGVAAVYQQNGNSLEVTAQPIQWNPDWFEATCVDNPCPSQGVKVEVLYTTELRFISEHVVEVSNLVTSQDTVDHFGVGQEWPTMYVSFGKNGDPDLLRLLDSTRQLINIGTPSGIYLFQDFISPRPWVTFQNATEDYGVGLAMDQGITGFQAWAGGPSAPYFHNVRARADFNIPAGGQVRGRSYIALGGFTTVQAELEDALKKRPPFGWLDHPANVTTNYTPGAQISIQGWVLDSVKVNNVAVEIDGTVKATIPVSVNRADVCTVYPVYPGCPTVGFGGNVSTAGLSTDCPHLLRVVATDVDGNRSVLGERALVPTP